MATTKSGKLEVNMDLRELKQEITNIIDAKSGCSISEQKYWENDIITVNHDFVQEIEEVMWDLKRANKNGTHEKFTTIMNH